MALLSADQILAVDDRKYETVEVPEWGGEVRLRSLSAAERDRFELSMQMENKGSKKQNQENFRARLIGLCAVNADGSKLFTNSQQIQMLGGKSSSALARVFDVATKMNGLSESDVDELTEDFEEAPSAPSTSDSVSPLVTLQ